jgi:MFS transporter, DHA1 family, tetracycline resistance protein
MFAAFSLAQFVFAPLMGNLADRFGRRPLLLLAIFGLGMDFILMALAPSLEWLFVGRVIAGVCGASWIIASAFIADVTTPDERAKAYGLMGAAFGVGFVIGPAIGGLLGELGPRVPFWVAAGISLLNFVYGWLVLPESLAPGKRRKFELWRANPFGAFRVFATYRGVLPMVLVMGLFFFSTSVYPAIWAFWGIAKFGWSEAMVGGTLAVFGLVAGGFQGFLTGPASKRFGEWNVAFFGLICATLVLTGIRLCRQPWRGDRADDPARAGGVRASADDLDADAEGARGCAGRVAGRHFGGDEPGDAVRHGLLCLDLRAFHGRGAGVAIA